jgi:uroporphyrinogen-III decarboxylase
MTKGTISNKILIQNLFALRETVRLPFIPIIYRFGAKITQISPKEMMGDATELTHSLLTCQELFGYDAVASGFDIGLHGNGIDSLPSSSDGGSSTLTFTSEPLKGSFQIEDMEGYRVAVETTRRLSQMVAKKIGLFGFATGPVTLAGYLGGRIVLEDSMTESSRQFLETATEICLKISKTYGELQVDGMIFLEWALSSPALRSVESYAPIYQTLHNVIHFYNSRLIIALPRFDSRHLKPLCQFKPDALLLGKCEEGEFSFSNLKELTEAHQICLGIGIPFFSGKEETVKTLDWVIQGMEKERTKRGIFLSSAGEVPYEMEVGEMHDFMERVKQIHL